MPPQLQSTPSTDPSASAILDLEGLSKLLDTLRCRGYELIGPTIRDSAIVLDEIRSLSDLPAGWTDEQDGGIYRLKRREDAAVFGFSVGPHSWRKYLFPAAVRLWKGERQGDDDFRILGQDEEPIPPPAFIGARSCDLHAIEIQDRVFLQGTIVDPHYQRRRDGNFVVAVNCGQAGATCFCVSQNTGPRATFGYDLALTELLDEEGHRFVVDIGTDLGRDILNAVAHRGAEAPDVQAAEAVIERTAAAMGRSLDNDGIKELLYANLEHPRWDEVAMRCLSCANCTLVCPTCLCSTVEDTSDVTGDHAERWRKWDSCFTADHSYLHGGSVRQSTRSRYRQWLTHKLGTWIDQFGVSGCVGCGRCITWCPVGIDITEETAALRATDVRLGHTEGGTADVNGG